MLIKKVLSSHIRVIHLMRGLWKRIVQCYARVSRHLDISTACVGAKKSIFLADYLFGGFSYLLSICSHRAYLLVK